MKKKLVLLTILITISLAGVYLYVNRDIFSSKHRISFSNTPDSILAGVKVYALLYQTISDTIEYEDTLGEKFYYLRPRPDTVEYKNGTWYGNDEPAILVYGSKTNYGLSKEYLNPIFYLTIHDKYYTDFSRVTNLKEKGKVYDFDFTINPVANYRKFDVKLNVTYHGRVFRSDERGWIRPLGRGVKTTGAISGTKKTEWIGDLTEEEKQVLGN